MSDEPQPHHILSETLPRIRSPKFEITITDPVAFARWCAERGTTPEAYLERWDEALTPIDRFRVQE